MIARVIRSNRIFQIFSLVACPTAGFRPVSPLYPNTLWTSVY
jgi:hypothetical protein